MPCCKVVCKGGAALHCHCSWSGVPWTRLEASEASYSQVVEAGTGPAEGGAEDLTANGGLSMPVSLCHAMCAQVSAASFLSIFELPSTTSEGFVCDLERQNPEQNWKGF